MKNHSAIPPRVGTAPMSKTVQSLADFRSALPARGAPPSGAGGLPRAPPAGGLPGKPPAAAAAAAAAPARSPSSEAAKARSGTTSPSAEAAADSIANTYPEDCVYEIVQFIQLKQCQTPLPPLVMEYASKLWKEMPEHISSVQNNTLRDSLFKEANATMPSKVLQERKLHNEVLGILGKVTDQNLERMKKELTDLPIRQSTEDEIREVINTFFRKCTRPEDTRYTPLYVQLIRHLVGTIGEHEPAGAMIRREILFQCRDTFTNATDDAKELEDRIADLPEEEAQLERMQFTGKQKANIYFLGLLYCNHIAKEHVVMYVLEHLLYGDGRRRRVVPDYCVVHFLELLGTCGPYLTETSLAEFIPSCIKTLSDLRRTHNSLRVKILVENSLETINNNWVPVHGKSARPAEEQQAAMIQRSASLLRLPNMQAALREALQDPSKRVPDREEFWKAMDDFFTTNDIDEIKPLVALIPKDTLVLYTSKWIGRYVTTYKYTQERGRLGELFEQLDSKNVMDTKTAQDALMMHVEHAVDEDLFTDQPKYFTHWASVIKGGRGVFTPSLHTRLLETLVSHHVSHSVLEKAITDINKVVEDGQKPDQKEYQAADRFRALQALLRYHPAFLTDPEDLSDEEEDDDIVRYVGDLEVDVEVTFFKILCDCYDMAAAQPAQQYVTEALKKSQSAAFPLISAFFTFARYDAENLCNMFREALKKIASARPLPVLMEEMYVEWKALDCPESQYTHFLRRFMGVVSPTKNDAVEKLKERLRAEYTAEKMIYLIEKAFK